MSAAIETISNLQRRIKITVSNDEMNRDYQKKLNEYKKNMKLKGFRPGKVPESVIEKRYGKAIRQEVRDHSLQRTFMEAVKDNDLRIVGMPDITPAEWTPGEDLQIEAEFEVYPEISLDNLNSLSATKYQVEVADSDVDEMISNLASQYTEWEPVERAAQDGDRVEIDFVGTIDGEVFDGGKADDFSVVIGAKRMIPGFEEGLVGIEQGVTRELKLVFPEQYHAKDLAGEPVEFNVTAKSIQAPKKPAIDDELAKKLGFANGLDALKKVVRERLESESSTALVGTQKETILDQLVEANRVELPKRLMDTEIDYLQRMAKQQAMSRGELKPEDAAETTFPREDYVEQAERRVLLGLILSEIVKKFEIKVDHMAVRQRVEQIAMGYPNPSELMEWLYKDRSRLAEIETSVLEDQAIRRILDEMDAESTVISYQDAVKKIQEAHEKEQAELSQ